MHTRTTLIAAGSVAMLALAGCSTGSETEPSGSESDGMDAMAGECLPVPGESLVVLEDDQQLQNSDNIVPLGNADVADESLMGILDVVADNLTTDELIQLNKAVDIDRMTSAEVAEEWVSGLDVAFTQVVNETPVVVGAANFSENITLAEIYADLLGMAGYTDVTVREIGNRETYLPALESGEISVVPEYAATVTEFLNQTINGADAESVASGDIDETIAALEPLAAERGLTVGTPAAAQDQNAFAVTAEFAAEYGVSTLSELAATCTDGIVMGGPPEFPERPFGQPGLEATYGIVVSDFVSLDAGGPLTKTAILEGEIAMGLVFSSDGALG